MDFLFWTTILLSGIALVVASYDIACQWSVNLHARAKRTFAQYYNTIASITLCFLIPNFHLHGHGDSCQEDYSFHLTSGVGTSHGETIEQEWGHIGPVATSTREMGPGSREETL